MADEHDRSALIASHILHLSQTFFLERRVADGEDLVDDQDLSFDLIRIRSR
jgi:hypothetical protein